MKLLINFGCCLDQVEDVLQLLLCSVSQGAYVFGKALMQHGHFSTLRGQAGACLCKVRLSEESVPSSGSGMGFSMVLALPD